MLFCFLFNVEWGAAVLKADQKRGLKRIDIRGFYENRIERSFSKFKR